MVCVRPPYQIKPNASSIHPYSIGPYIPFERSRNAFGICAVVGHILFVCSTHTHKYFSRISCAIVSSVEHHTSRLRRHFANIIQSHCGGANAPNYVLYSLYYNVSACSILKYRHRKYFIAIIF